MAALFEGKQLLTKTGLQPAAEVLKDKYVALYFSAHWCPPCRGFTPQLAGVYDKVLQQKGLEIVFVSSDKDQAAFDEYYAEQPWLALPYEDREGKSQLSAKFKVSGIPTLVVLDKDGSLLTKDGRAALSEDPQAAAFPDGWRPPKLEEVLKGLTVIDHDGAKGGVPATEVLMLYFSAHWCPPCQKFTPKFAEVYKALKAAGKEFEVVFVSSDRDEAQFNEYFASMPWKALAFEERAKKQQLSRLFEVSGIPTVIVLQRAADGAYSLITDDAVSRIAADASGTAFPYHPPLVHDADESLGPLNELPVVALLAEHAAAAERDALEAALRGAAERERAAGGDARVGFVAFKGSGGRGAQVGKIVRQKLAPAGVKVEEGTAVVMLDVQGDRVLVYNGDLGALTAEGVHAWADAFLKGTAAGVVKVEF